MKLKEQLLYFMAAVFALSGCATMVNDPTIPLEVSFSDGSSGQCTFKNKRGTWSSEIPTTSVMIRRSDDELVYDCSTADGRKATGSLESEVEGGKMAASVVFWDLGTPLTNVHYLNATRGNLYGISKTPRQVGPLAFPIKSEIEGLYMVGASTTSHGVGGVTASGLACAQRILGLSSGEILNQNGPEIEIYPSEDISMWPDYLQKKVAKGKEK